MDDITINGVSWSLQPVPLIPFEQFVAESSMVYRDYSEQDRLTLLQMAYNYIYGKPG